MLIKRPPYQFWNYRDVRKKKLVPITSPELMPVYTSAFRTVHGMISHHILLPLKELPNQLIQRLKADLTLPNPEFISASKYGKGFVSYAIPEFVYLYCIDTEYIGLPRSIRLPYLHKQFTKCGLKLELEDVKPQFELLTWKECGEIKPYFYQNDAIKKIVEENVTIKFRCGKGKSYIALMALAKIGLKALIIVRTNVLITQWVESIKKIFNVSKEQIGIINGKIKREGQITVCTEQSLISLSREEKKRIGKVYGFICCDEGHQVCSKKYHDLITYFKAKRLCALTATPDREDGMTPILKAYVGPIYEVDDLGEFQTRIFLRKTDFIYQFNGKKDKYHELINALIHDEKRNQLIIDDIKEFLNSGKIIICYSNRILHMELLQNMIKKQAPSVKTNIVASRKYGVTLKIEDNDKTRDDLKSMKIQGIFAGKIAEEGFDCPSLSVAIMATPSKSIRLILQVLGRCQREWLGKKEAVLLDYVDEKCKILLYQFFSKNRRIYKDYKKEYLTDGSQYYLNMEVK